MSGYLRFLSEKDNVCYLSPDEIKSLKHKNYRPKDDT